MVWLTGGALAICVFMVAGLLLLVLAKGMTTFWPSHVVKVTTLDGRVYMGEITRKDYYHLEEEALANLPEAVRGTVEVTAEGDSKIRRLFRTGNYRLTQNHFNWVSDFEVAERTEPDWAVVMERLEWGRFYGFPEAFAELTFLEDGSAEEATRVAAELRGQGGDLQLLVGSGPSARLVPLADAETAGSIRAVAVVTEGAEAAWRAFEEHHGPVRERWEERRHLEKFDTGEVNHKQEQARLEMREIELELERARGTAAEGRLEEEFAQSVAEFEEVRTWANREFDRIRLEIDAINRENEAFQILMRTPGEGTREPQLTLQRVDEVVLAYPANQLSFGQKLGIYVERWGEFLTDEPREANSEGGVYPAIFGTVAMTLIMSLAVVPFGVLAALYLREYAKAGPLVSAVRIAVNNLSGVPSIVFGVFGLGFFCYVVGANIDQLLFAAELPNPTYGKGGLLWASLTLALLTLPVIIVSTEEAVSAVPNSMREGSYACGASKWQTIQRIVLPRALPGIITGMILAIARGAGEVAPLMLVGAVKLAPELPVDTLFPYVHPERSFMHLGFHIFDVGFQSQNSEASKPMVFTTTLLLIGIVAVLNFTAIWLRNRLRAKFAGDKF
ncbi:MAG: phosphate ABC transporter permease PstA [Acidobacteriota bacterium]